MEIKIFLQSLDIWEKKEIYTELQTLFNRKTIGDWARENKNEISLRLYNCCINIEKQVHLCNKHYGLELLFCDSISENLERLQRVRNFGKKTYIEFFEKFFRRPFYQ
jgi:hypothetical protein